jgi:hypothetical protein
MDDDKASTKFQVDTSAMKGCLHLIGISILSIGFAVVVTYAALWLFGF